MVKVSLTIEEDTIDVIVSRREHLAILKQRLREFENSFPRYTFTIGGEQAGIERDTWVEAAQDAVDKGYASWAVPQELARFHNGGNVITI